VRAVNKAGPSEPSDATEPHLAKPRNRKIVYFSQALHGKQFYDVVVSIMSTAFILMLSQKQITNVLSKTTSTGLLN